MKTLEQIKEAITVVNDVKDKMIQAVTQTATSSGSRLLFFCAKVQENAVLPTRATEGSAGYDLTACEDAIIPARGWKMIDTGIAIQIPKDCYARVAPRSGLTLKKGLSTGAGVVDSDYRDSIRVILFNHSDMEVEVQSGDRIAQLIFERIYTPSLKEVSYENLTNTARGVGGFGSTGN